MTPRNRSKAADLFIRTLRKLGRKQPVLEGSSKEHNPIRLKRWNKLRRKK